MTEAEHDNDTGVTPAAGMEAEERELVIENSVDDLVTYADRPLSDREIEAERLHLHDIKPQSEDI
ncbi:hypothetical protein V6667_09160 [Neisseria leonii]|uniref:Uncharacterized protein n=1 Tax=Neisseria leonii TaxID=2995413 RepID=A0A9X4E5M1_9NEIS|nr:MULTISPECIES: hypothetical protein [unclassified Neisseria]MDD9325731.1 hypothetical protein [Neisseria sp. 3986]MDD9327872.1 hypothetical protein [Neisseria sp. 51.81]